VLVSAALLGACGEARPETRPVTGADPETGLALIRQTGCAACHAVPGVRWPQGRAGGSLAGFGSRPLIAGRLPNQPDVLVRWILDAPALSPGVAMPPQPVTEAEARHIAAYLYELRDD
jgi:sulfur-oxidizing protein SoxX